MSVNSAQAKELLWCNRHKFKIELKDGSSFTYKMTPTNVAIRAVKVAEEDMAKKAVMAFKSIFNEHPELEQQFINYLTV